MLKNRTHNRRLWRSLPRRMRVRLGKNQKLCLLLLVLLLQLGAYLLYLWLGPKAKYHVHGPAFDGNGNQIVFQGESVPKNPSALGGMTTSTRRYTPAQLEEEFGDMDIIYTFVNGSEPNHAFRRTVLRSCVTTVLEAEKKMYDGVSPRIVCSGEQVLPNSKTNADVLKMMERFKSPTMLSSRDRERDELKYSIRSVEQHMRWHRGRLLIISPGHHPRWIDDAKNFFSGACRSGRESAGPGRHTRIITVHQDAVMPYGMRLTIDSHVIEQHIFRVRKATPIHVFMNDDYFINRDNGVDDLLNEYGGTYVRTEAGMLRKTKLAHNGSSWIEGVYNTNLFNVLELDYAPEDELLQSLVELWTKKQYDYTQKIPVPSINSLVHTAYEYKPEKRPEEKKPIRPRFFATHAPFVYCTRMFEHFQTRYTPELAFNALQHRSRKATDLFVPFLYNAFIMARPWQSSPRFLPYLAALQASRAQKKPAPDPIDIRLDNRDACAPATLLRHPASKAMYAKFVDEYDKNVEVIKQLDQRSPFFFNINDGFTSSNSSDQLQNFLGNRFPQPSFVEHVGGAAAVDADGAMAGVEQQEEPKPSERREYDETFQALMRVPLIILSSSAEAFCPLVRSVHLALRQFQGPIIVSRSSFGDGAHGDVPLPPDEDTIAERRAALKHRVRSAMPVAKCTFGPKVYLRHVNTKSPDLASGVGRVLSEMRADQAFAQDAVRLPEDYIGGSHVYVRAMVIDARTPPPSQGKDSVEALEDALQVPGQTLALEDFKAVELPDKQVALVIAFKEAEDKAVHWVNGASEEDLLITFPLPSAEYEDLDANVRWTSLR